MTPAERQHLHAACYEARRLARRARWRMEAAERARDVARYMEEQQGREVRT
jgi:hypothetical protein